MKNFFITKNFFNEFSTLRAEFEKNFENPKATHQKRFVWDFWYDEDLYHAVRTPAFYYFNKKSYHNFHSFLVNWGREYLGCHDISPPWLSYYVDGCFQNMHADVPHGPWAFVYSLTPSAAAFRGGETFILKPETLDYWSSIRNSNLLERGDFMNILPSKMNELIVFDPRFPHGVTEVKGTRDPLQSRLVMHGWFVNPRPYVVGGLGVASVQKVIDKTLNALVSTLEQISEIDGTLSVRMKISKSGLVQDYKLLTDTLVSLNPSEQSAVLLKRELKSLFKAALFPKAKSESQITLPLMFK